MSKWLTLFRELDAATLSPVSKLTILPKSEAVAHFGVNVNSATGGNPVNALLPAITDDEWQERAAIAEFDGKLCRVEAESVADAQLGLHRAADMNRREERVEGVALDAAGDPSAPCSRCGGLNFWRRSLTPTSPWHCASCVPPLPNVITDGCSLPTGRTGR